MDSSKTLFCLGMCPQKHSSALAYSLSLLWLNYRISCPYKVQLMEWHTLVISAIFPPILITINKTLRFRPWNLFLISVGCSWPFNFHLGRPVSHHPLRCYWRAILVVDRCPFFFGDLTSFPGVFPSLLCCLFSVCFVHQRSSGSPAL